MQSIWRIDRVSLSGNGLSVHQVLDAAYASRMIRRIGCGDEIEVSDDESSDLEEYWSDKEETTKFFKIETIIFDYETPLCLAFHEFNYFLKVDLDLLTKDIMGFKTYEDYKDDWIYEWNENVPWV
ncbi:hypothetical protein Tco_1323801, partial [Tanacetum coccineum]